MFSDNHFADLGLSENEAGRRLAQYGANEITPTRIKGLKIFFRQFQTPFVFILIFSSLLAFFLGESASSLIVLGMIFLSAILGFYNEYCSEKIVESLNKRVALHSEIWRGGKKKEIFAKFLVPGDIVGLYSGDLVPADLEILEENNLEIDEATLTGEPFPVKKTVGQQALMGTAVIRGAAVGRVLATGLQTQFGQLAKTLKAAKPPTSSKKGIEAFGLLLVRGIILLTIIIFFLNFWRRGDLLDAFLFALAVAVGLTPEFLPVIISLNLARGAHRMAKKHVVVKRLMAIENFGNIDILATDKTGTLTEGEIILADYLNRRGEKDQRILELGLLASAVYYDSRLASTNPLEAAIFNYAKARHIQPASDFQKIRELPFDYERQLGAVLLKKDDEILLITKGAPEAVLPLCQGKTESISQKYRALACGGVRLVAVASKKMAAGKRELNLEDEKGLQFEGFLTFADPPKKDAARTLLSLEALGVTVKILTGDNEWTTGKLIKDLDLPLTGMITGPELGKLNDEQFCQTVREKDIFCRVTPEQKLAIIGVYKKTGHAVGFLGDGINDAPALYQADVGISVDEAADVSKEAADIVLLKKSLAVLAEGIIEGRKTFANTLKYILMEVSSNYGNMFSVALGSFFLPFLPMLPMQILFLNFLYEISQVAITSDLVDSHDLEKPRFWDVKLIRNFMFFFGPFSSLFDFATYFVMLLVFQASAPLFQTGWFVESLVSEALIIFAIRTRRVPFWRSRPASGLILAMLGIVGIGLLTPYSPWGKLLGFVPLPRIYFPILIGIIISYFILIEFGKLFFYRRWGKSV